MKVIRSNTNIVEIRTMLLNTIRFNYLYEYSFTLKIIIVNIL